MQTKTVAAAVAAGNQDDADYSAYLERLRRRFLANVEAGGLVLFTTDAAGMFDAYLAAFDADGERQHHNCHACKSFIERYGGLVTIDAAGRTAPAVWHEDDADDAYRPAVAALAKRVRRAKVTGVFLSSDRTWGQPVTGEWRHLAVTPPPAMVVKVATPSTAILVNHSDTLTAGQRMAARREDFQTVTTALNEYTLPVIDQALTLLRSESLYRSEKVLGQAEWLQRLHVARNAARGPARANVVWRFIATAPAGFCHPRSSMIGTLLDDIAAGHDFAGVSRRFAAKMHPLQYQRPQAAPAAGAIAEAERLIDRLGAAGSLARRFARLDEVQALWTPKARKEAPAAGGVFGHLKAKNAPEPLNLQGPPVTMTWEKFARTVLPTADRLQFRAPGLGPYSSLVTAVNADAPPILQWDSAERRNPVSWYFWHGGSTAAQFNLTAGAFHDVAAVTLKPSMWNGGHEHQGAAVMFVIEGARDTRKPSACLFPEMLKAEYRGARSVIEAYSNGATIDGADEASAAGIMLAKGGSGWYTVIRVWSGGHRVDYSLDRWD